MKAISLWQPWASAMVLGLKKIETRHWFTAYRGPIAIHAAKRWSGEERELAQQFAERYGFPELAVPPLGAVVAVAEIVSVLRTEDISHRLSATELDFGNYAAGRYGWRFERLRALETPIPFKGAQGFFNVPDSIIGQMPRQGELFT